MAAGGKPPACYVLFFFNNEYETAVHKTPAQITQDALVADLNVRDITTKRGDLIVIKKQAQADVDELVRCGAISEYAIITMAIAKTLIENMPPQPKYRIEDFNSLDAGRAGNYCFLGGPTLNARYGLISSGTRNDVVYKTDNGYLLVRDSDRKFIYVPNTWRKDVDAPIQPGLEF